MLQFLCLLALVALSAGKSFDQQIVNGEVADPEDVPWQLSLQYDGSHICGAVAINEEFVLTAAHCVDFYEPGAIHLFKFACGLHNLQDDLGNEYATLSTAVDIRLHENWDPNGLGFPNDIALVKVSPPFQFNSRCQPALLPRNNDKTFAGKDSIISGWGRLYGGGPIATLLKKATIKVITNQDCGRDYQIIFIPYIRDTHICVKDQSGLIGACNGDSGGPLTAPDFDTGNVKVVGLTSFGRAGCDTAYASVYTRVSSYLTWIHSTMGQMH